MSLNPSSWLEPLRVFDRLLILEAKLTKILDQHTKDIQELKDSLTELRAFVQAREDIMVAKAEGAAAAAAGAAVSQSMMAIGQSLGRLEARMDGMTQGRLAGPDRDA
jgi:hypothetical protein